MKSIIFSILFFLSIVTFADQVQKKSLCTKDEQALFWCSHKSTTYSLCASKELTKSTGYIQYRVSKANKIEMEYPKSKVRPIGKFMYAMDTKGGGVIFANGVYQYQLYSSATGNLITVDKNEHEISRFECNVEGNDIDLSMTPIMKLLQNAGLECPARDCLTKK